MNSQYIKYIFALAVIAVLVFVVVNKKSEVGEPTTDGTDMIGNSESDSSLVNNPASPKKPGASGNPVVESDPKAMTIDMKTWTLVSALYRNGSEFIPKTPGKFSLTFAVDGSFHASTDCNSLSGSYQVTGDAISFGGMASTKMYCPGSQEKDFEKVLQEATSFSFSEKGELVMKLGFDSGTATFK